MKGGEERLRVAKVTLTTPNLTTTSREDYFSGLKDCIRSCLSTQKAKARVWQGRGGGGRGRETERGGGGV